MHSRTPEAYPPSDWSELHELREQLLQLPPNVLCEPRVRLSVVVQEAKRLSATTRQRHIRSKLLAAGLADECLDVLDRAIHALRVAQGDMTRSRCPDGDLADALDSALELRDEMVAACQWNLRQRDVAAHLVRITDSSDLTELSLDLKELAQLVQQYASDFEFDGTFDGPECVRQALALADELTATASGEVSEEVRELRDRAFTHLANLMEEIRSAGRYAFRADPESRRLFAAETPLTRRRSSLSSMVNSLIG